MIPEFTNSIKQYFYKRIDKQLINSCGSCYNIHLYVKIPIKFIPLTTKWLNSREGIDFKKYKNVKAVTIHTSNKKYYVQLIISKIEHNWKDWFINDRN